MNIYIERDIHVHERILFAVEGGEERPEFLPLRARPMWAGPLWAPRCPCRPPLGPGRPGPCGLPWALVGSPVPLRAGPLWAGPLRARPLWRHLAPHGPGPDGPSWDTYVYIYIHIGYMYIYIYIFTKLRPGRAFFSCT